MILEACGACKRPQRTRRSPGTDRSVDRLHGSSGAPQQDPIQTDSPVRGFYKHATYLYVQVPRPTGAVQIQVTGTLSKATRTGLEPLDSFETGTYPCSGTWTNYSTSLFDVFDTD